MEGGSPNKILQHPYKTPSTRTLTTLFCLALRKCCRDCVWTDLKGKNMRGKKKKSNFKWFPARVDSKRKPPKTRSGKKELKRINKHLHKFPASRQGRSTANRLVMVLWPVTWRRIFFCISGAFGALSWRALVCAGKKGTLLKILQWSFLFLHVNLLGMKIIKGRDKLKVKDESTFLFLRCGHRRHIQSGKPKKSKGGGGFQFSYLA